ncbi:MAG: DUF1934 domain-containing protein [Clostridia bacterium]|nr:DUF1934 domain-containing protein [Clostridia bacterium]
MVIKEAKIKIESVIQNLDAVGLADGDPERSSNEGVGYYHFDEEKILITYSEQTEGGRLTSEVLVTGGAVRVRRSGAIESDMEIREGVTDHSVYSIPPYKFDMEISGRRVRLRLDCDGGEIDLSYSMKIGGAEKSARMKIWIQTA